MNRNKILSMPVWDPKAKKVMGLLDVRDVVSSVIKQFPSSEKDVLCFVHIYEIDDIVYIYIYPLGHILMRSFLRRLRKRNGNLNISKWLIL